MKENCTIDICNMQEFQKLILDDVKEVKSVNFRGMEVNEEFVDGFGTYLGMMLQLKI